MSILSIIWPALITALFLFAAYGYRPLQNADLWLGDGAIFLGVALLLWRLRRQTLWQRQTFDFQATSSKVSYVYLLLGALCLWLMADTSAPQAGVLPFTWGMPHSLQFSLWVLGIGLIALGALGGVKPRSLPRLTPCWSLLLIIALAFILRIINLDGAVHAYIDETHFAQAVIHLWENPSQQLLTHISPIAAFTHIYPYFQHLSIQIFGASLGGLRMASVIIGTLTIPALYMLGSALFSRKVGLLAALLLAVFPPHIHFSRLALNNIADPLFGVLALWLVVRALQRRSASDWLLAGVTLGLTQYFYEGGRLLFPALVVLWLLFYVRQLPLRAWLYWALGFALVAFPIYYVLWLWRAAPVTRLVLEGMGNDFWARFLAADAGFPQLALYLRERFMPALLHIFHNPDGSAFYYGGDTPLLWLPLVPLFFIGLTIAMRSGKRGLLLWSWLLLTVLGNSLIVENDWSARFVVLFPALALLTALGLEGLFQLWRMATIPIGHLRRVGVVVVTLLAVAQVGYYFGLHLTRYNQQIRPFLDHQDVGFRSALLPAGTDVYLLTNELTFQPHIDTHFRLVGVEGVRVVILPPWAYPYESIHRLPLHHTSFFFAPKDAETLWHLRRVYGACLDGPYFSPYNVPLEKQYVQYNVSPACLRNPP